ncbi:4Fe-4S ferredoxin [Candidatus Magnetomoraceae bacterium gMMP-15]
MSTELKKVMVIGGGVAGLTAAWELARENVNVELIEKAGFLGGHGIQFSCKATDKCHQCGACSVEKVLKDVIEEPKINIHIGTEIEKVSKNGNFSVNLKKSESSQTGTEIDQVYSKNNLSLKSAESCDSLDVDAIILASGFTPFNPEIKSTYGYGKFKNMISGLDLERNKKRQGGVLRPSDGKPPKKVAFIQCVGSRDERLGNLWCSQVCCPYALRLARSLKFVKPETEITVFYMDIQNASKNFSAFYEKCKEELNFVRNIPVDMYPSETDGLRTRYADESGAPIDDEFDLVVLSIGITPNADNNQLSELLGIELNLDGFFLSNDLLNKTITSQDGIFIAGTAQGPKSIPASMAHAGQAACEVMKYLGGL